MVEYNLKNEAFNKITLLCLSYERHYYLKRSIKYFSQTNVKIIYCDGSSKPLNLDDTNIEKFENIHYIHLNLQFLDRMKYLFKLIKTPYVSIIGDEEFYMPTSILNCINFLENNYDYVACMGAAAEFNKFRGKVVLGNTDENLYNKVLDSNNTFKRLKDHFMNYSQVHVFSIVRSEIFINTFKSIINFRSIKMRLDIFAITEIAHEFLIVNAGKTKVLNNLFWLRSNEAQPIRNTGEVGSSLKRDFCSWWRSNQIKDREEHNKFINYLMNESLNKVKKEEVIEVLNCVYDYLNKKAVITVNSNSFFYKLVKKFFPKIFIKLIIKFIKFIKYYYKVFISIYNIENNNKRALNNLRRNNIIFNISELDNFKEVCEKY